MKTKYMIIILLIFIIILFLIYKNKENFLVGNEAIQNITKLYADVSGTAIFNKINANDIKINNNLDVSGIKVNNNLQINGKLLYKSTDATKVAEGMHTFQIKTGTNRETSGQIINPDGDTYSNTDWICFATGQYDKINLEGIRTYVNSENEKWYFRKYLDWNGEYETTIICFPKNMFSKAWGCN